MNRRIFSALLAGLFVVLAAPAQVSITAARNGQFHVEMEGKPFGDFYTAKEFPKPFFSPLRTATGKIVTREWPMVPDSGQSRDHQHHRGLWFGYLDVNGTNFWENEFSYHRANAGKIVAKDVSIVIASGGKAALRGDFDWVSAAGQTVLNERRTMTFQASTGLRIVDIDIVLTAKVAAVFADDKDGALGVRMADALTEKQTGILANSLGGRTMKEVWGKRAGWCDYSGLVDGEKAGLVMFEHPSSYHHPTRWHARDYGLLSANPFADHAYDDAAAVRHTALDPGQTVHLRYRVITHGELSRESIEKLYREYSSLP